MSRIEVENRDCGGKLWRDYLRTAIDYVHLNPGRAGLIDGVNHSTAEYEWSSLTQGYRLPPSKRPKWLANTLDLKSSANSSQQIRRFAKVDEKELPLDVRKWKTSRNVAFSET